MTLEIEIMYPYVALRNWSMKPAAVRYCGQRFVIPGMVVVWLFLSKPVEFVDWPEQRAA